MSLPVTSLRDGDFVEKQAVPPLFAGPLRDDLLSRIRAALSAGDCQKGADLLQEADGSFPGDPVFPALHSLCIKLSQRKAHFETALQEAFQELSEDRYVSSFGKFREALALSRGYEVWERQIYEAGVEAAGERAPSHWRFAEALLHEVTAVAGQRAVPNAVWASIERQRREESVRVALDESGRAEHSEYLPHLRERLAELAETYPEETELEARLRALERLLEQRFAEEREKNLRRLTLFRDRLDLSGNPQTLRRFQELVAPFVSAYPGDAAFLAIIDELHGLRSRYDHASRLVAESRSREALEVCDQVLQQRPSNVLFGALEQQAKAREWAVRLAHSAMQRARGFEEKAQYAEALEEWEALREIDPHFPGLDSEILHCATLKQQTESVRPSEPLAMDETALTPEIVSEETEEEYEAPPLFVARPRFSALSFNAKIAITEEAWNHLKTGLAATAAILLVVLVIASNTYR